MATWTKFNKFPYHLANKEIDLDTDNFKCMLTSTAPAATDEYRSGLSGTEVSGGGYTAGGIAVGGTSATLTESSGTTTWDLGNATWSQDASGFDDATHAVIYQDTGTDTTDILCAYCAFSSAKGNVDGDLTVEITDVFDIS